MNTSLEVNWSSSILQNKLRFYLPTKTDNALNNTLIVYLINKFIHIRQRNEETSFPSEGGTSSETLFLNEGKQWKTTLGNRYLLRLQNCLPPFINFFFKLQLFFCISIIKKNTFFTKQTQSCLEGVIHPEFKLRDVTNVIIVYLFICYLF